MRYSIKVVFNDKIEPTSVVETEDFEKIKEIAIERLAEIADNSTDVTGVFISRTD